MYLTRHETATAARWALDGRGLPPAFTLGLLLQMPGSSVAAFLASLPKGEPPAGRLLPPIEPGQEVWASGVTYLRSRDARTAESGVKDVYERVYEAERPELFFKATGRRAVGHGMEVRVRADATWSVPEPELTLVVNRGLEIVGYTAGNDMSSRDIEGENPLYLPQAKVFNGSCAVGPGIEIVPGDELGDVAIRAEIERAGVRVFEGETRSSRMRRRLADLARYLGRELDFPEGALLMTGTGIVPPDDLSLLPGDLVRVTVGSMTLENRVGGH
jgi:2-dehydro-3-deoxy-D-arabinonate dehydratase